MTEDPRTPNERPARALAAHSYLLAAAPENDYYKTHDSRVDTSLWALLFFMVRSGRDYARYFGYYSWAKAKRNRMAVVWGAVAIFLSIALPLGVYWYVMQRPAEVTVGSTVEAQIGISVAVPKGATLLNDNDSGLLYDASDGEARSERYYGIYAVARQDDHDITAEALAAILADETDVDYTYWLYQLFEQNGLSVDTITSSSYQQGVAEVVVDSYGQPLVAALHVEDEAIYVQYITGDITMLAASLMVNHVLGSSTTDTVSAWRDLVKSVSVIGGYPDDDELEPYNFDEEVWRS